MAGRPPREVGDPRRLGDMTASDSAEIDLEPLTTDDRILRRARDLVGRATLRQVWWFLLDADDRQIPLLLPVSGLPHLPSPDSVDLLAHRLGVVCRHAEASAVVLVWERRGQRALTEADRRWAAVFAAAGHRASIPIRAQLLSHSGGVRWVAPDDYLSAFPTDGPDGPGGSR